MRRTLNWGVAVAAGYAIFAGGTIGFVAFAMSERVDLVSEDYYAQSLVVDRQTRARANAEALGPAFSAEVSDDATSFELQWPAGAVAERGTVTLYRPADSRRDRTIVVTPDGDGRQTVDLRGLAPGRWLVRAAWSVGEQEYFVERSAVIR